MVKIQLTKAMFFLVNFVDLQPKQISSLEHSLEQLSVGSSVEQESWFELFNIFDDAYLTKTFVCRFSKLYLCSIFLLVVWISNSTELKNKVRNPELNANISKQHRHAESKKFEVEKHISDMFKDHTCSEDLNLVRRAMDLNVDTLNAGLQMDLNQVMMKPVLNACSKLSRVGKPNVFLKCTCTNLISNVTAFCLFTVFWQYSTVVKILTIHIIPKII